MIAIVVIVSVLIALHFKSLGGVNPTGAPRPGGADGSPQSIKAYGDKNATAHAFESALGAVGGAGACTYFGAAAAAPVCAKIGAYLGPKAVALGSFTTIKSIQVAEKTNAVIGAVLNKGAELGTGVANLGASAGDRAFSAAGKISGPGKYLAQAAILPVKLTGDAGAAVAHTAEKGVKTVTGGVKKAGSAVESGVKKVLGWL